MRPELMGLTEIAAVGAHAGAGALGTGRANEVGLSPSQVTDIKAFVPAEGFALSRSFNSDLGFIQRFKGGGVAYFSVYACAFMRQDSYDAAIDDSLMLHLLVPDFAAWPAHADQTRLADRYGVRITAVVKQHWRITEFTVSDPSGVCWCIGQNATGVTPVGRLPEAIS